MEENDIKIENLYGNVKFRVNGVLICNNEILVVKMSQNNFYCLPGGHVKIAESSREAMLRENKEETGYNAHIEKLIAITENFFTRKNGKKIHELGFYYLLKLDDKENITKKEYETQEENEEKINLHFKWDSIEELKNIDFKPTQLKEKLLNKNFEFEHFIIK